MRHNCPARPKRGMPTWRGRQTRKALLLVCALSCSESVQTRKALLHVCALSCSESVQTRKALLLVCALSSARPTWRARLPAVASAYRNPPDGVGRTQTRPAALAPAAPESFLVRNRAGQRLIVLTVLKNMHRKTSYARASASRCLIRKRS